MFIVLDENNEYIGPPRVWLKSEEIPGLAMSRSFGDQVAASVGILAEPGNILIYLLRNYGMEIYTR